MYEREAAGLRHLDDREPTRQHTPCRVDGIAERSRSRESMRREPPRAASNVSRVPSPPSASGSSTTSSKPAAANARGHRARDLVRAERSSELVGTDDCTGQGGTGHNA